MHASSCTTRRSSCSLQPCEKGKRRKEVRGLAAGTPSLYPVNAGAGPRGQLDDNRISKTRPKKASLKRLFVRAPSLSCVHQFVQHATITVACVRALLRVHAACAGCRDVWIGHDLLRHSVPMEKPTQWELRRQLHWSERGTAQVPMLDGRPLLCRRQPVPPATAPRELLTTIAGGRWQLRHAAGHPEHRMR